ncbi:MAG: discoidin domain-containing protein [Polyangiaceae bacterium]|nr:discoidin domain-containing protein [Polyangiaceae bacterium]
MATVSAAIPTSWVGRASEWFLLRGAEARARSYAPEQAEVVARLHRAAAGRLLTARDLRDATALPAAAAILREAGALAAMALLVARDPRVQVLDLDPAEVWDRLMASIEGDPALGASVARLGPRLGPARGLILSRRPLEVDALPPAEALALLEGAEAVADWMLALAEPRSVRRLRVARVSRLALVAGGLVAGAAFVAVRSIQPSNVARGKPVEASGYWAGSAPADALVNGQREIPWASGTARGKENWFAVDLGQPHVLQRVVIVNREDKYAKETFPLVLEISEDGQAWEEVAQFDHATAGRELIWAASGRVARRLRVRHATFAKNIALSEIEAYGRPR